MLNSTKELREAIHVLLLLVARPHSGAPRTFVRKDFDKVGQVKPRYET